MNTTTPWRPAAGLATVMMMATPSPSDHAAAMLSRIVEAQAAADEANHLLGLGVIDHARYEAAACDRDEAIEMAAVFLGRAAR